MLCSIQLSPIGSVWIVHLQIEFASSTNSTTLQTLHWGVKAHNTNTWGLGGNGYTVPGCWYYAN
jgi:hypothetical protein